MWYGSWDTFLVVGVNDKFMGMLTIRPWLVREHKSWRGYFIDVENSAET